MKTYKLEQHEELRILRALRKEREKYEELLERAKREEKDGQVIHYLENEIKKDFALMVKFGYMGD